MGPIVLFILLHWPTCNSTCFDPGSPRAAYTPIFRPSIFRIIQVRTSSQLLVCWFYAELKPLLKSCLLQHHPFSPGTSKIGLFSVFQTYQMSAYSSYFLSSYILYDLTGYRILLLIYAVCLSKIQTSGPGGSGTCELETRCSISKQPLLM